MLKKSTTLLSILFISVKLLTAQTLSIGPMIGINSSTIEAASNGKGLTGLAIGGFANYSINEHVGIGAKLLYNQMGSAFTVNEDFNRLNYLQMPFTGTYYFGDAGNKFRPKVFAGPYVGRLLSTKNKNGNELLEANGENSYKKFDFGALFGLGFNYRIKDRTWLNVDAGYSHGFSDITTSEGSQFHNNSLLLNVGVSFPVGKQ